MTNFEGNGDVVGNGDTTLQDVLNVSTVSPVPTPPTAGLLDQYGDELVVAEVLVLELGGRRDFGGDDFGIAL